MNEPDKMKALAEFSLKELERRIKLFQTVRRDIRRNVWIGLILGIGFPVAMWIGREYFRANYAIQLLLYLIPLIAATSAAAWVTNSRIDALVELLEETDILKVESRKTGAGEK